MVRPSSMHGRFSSWEYSTLPNCVRVVWGARRQQVVGVPQRGRVKGDASEQSFACEGSGVPLQVLCGNSDYSGHTVWVAYRSRYAWLVCLSQTRSVVTAPGKKHSSRNASSHHRSKANAWCPCNVVALAVLRGIRYATHASTETHTEGERCVTVSAQVLKVDSRETWERCAERKRRPASRFAVIHKPSTGAQYP